jgi:hypothetical protein
MSDIDPLQLAERAQRVELRPVYERLVNVATELHLLANRHSGVRYEDDSDERVRASRGYRAELAVAQYYGLRPEVDYRPSGVGDLGRDLWAVRDGNCVAIDVKATRVEPPRLYLTRKRAWSDRYILPDSYLLASGALTDDDSIHLLGWCSSATAQRGRETEVYGNPVWVTPLDDLEEPPERQELEPVDEVTQLRLDVERAGAEFPERQQAVADGGESE